MEELRKGFVALGENLKRVALSIGENLRKIGGGRMYETEKAEGRFEKVGKDLGMLVDEKQSAYGDSISKTGDVLRVFLSDYEDEYGSYDIPDALIDHIGIMVRIIDKQNRIFSNPTGDKMEESPYKDIAGYGLLGHELIGGERE